MMDWAYERLNELVESGEMTEEEAKALEEQKEEKWISVTETWMMEELENQIKEGKGCLGRDEE